MIGFLPNIHSKFELSENFELTVFELTVPDLYIDFNSKVDIWPICFHGSSPRGPLIFKNVRQESGKIIFRQ